MKYDGGILMQLSWIRPPLNTLRRVNYKILLFVTKN